jgi:hypothetical protein
MTKSFVTQRRVKMDDINKESHLVERKVKELYRDYGELIQAFVKMNKEEASVNELDQILLSATLMLVREMISIVIEGMIPQGQIEIIKSAEFIFNDYVRQIKETQLRDKMTCN